MKAGDWDAIQHFHAGENWGDWTKMSYDFVRTLYTVRHLADTPFELTSPAYTRRTGHSKDSLHYYGRAADFWLPRKTPFQAYDLLALTLKDMGVYNKVGFGFYPDWTTPGFHFDDRAMHIGVGYKPAVVWVRIDNPKRGLPMGYTYGSDALVIIEKIRLTTH
jgi:hypothetical protein